MQRRRIRELQHHLRALGLYPGRLDGAPGPSTLHALDRLRASLPAPPAALGSPDPGRRLGAAMALLQRHAALHTSGRSG
ncbi:MAG: hypothetical protein AAF577_01900 [Pseudomonadota bacterium]